MRSGLLIKDVSMSYDGRPLFDGISVTIEAGQRIIVTGANGAGKTTFLKIVAGLVRPTAGRIALTFGDRAVDIPGERRRLVGYAGPDINAYDELTAIENLEFYANLRGTDSSKVSGLLDRVGLARSKQGSPVKTFSSGMRQRVRLACSLVGDPDIVIWDEPSAMLDGSGRRMVLDLIDAHAAADGIALMATNDPAEIGEWGDRRIHFGS